MLQQNVLPILGSLLLLAGGASAQPVDFTLCKGSYALCTTARCTPVAGKEDTVTCACEVRSGYSAGQDDCQPASETGKGTRVQSRYYPVKSLSICANDRPWANCLGKMCIVDKDDPAKAACACTTERNRGPYVIVGDAYTPQTCTTGIISSATVADNKGITEFLETTSELKPFAITVLNPAQSEGEMQPSGGRASE